MRAWLAAALLLSVEAPTAATTMRATITGIAEAVELNGDGLFDGVSAGTGFTAVLTFDLGNMADTFGQNTSSIQVEQFLGSTAAGPVTATLKVGDQTFSPLGFSQTFGLVRKEIVPGYNIAQFTVVASSGNCPTLDCLHDDLAFTFEDPNIALVPDLLLPFDSTPPFPLRGHYSRSMPYSGGLDSLRLLATHLTWEAAPDGVPEPAMLGLFGAAALGLTRRRAARFPTR